MKKYICSRILQLVFVLFGISLLSFALMQFAAGDYVDMTYEGMGIGASKQTKDAARAALGLDQSAVKQYFTWLKNLLHGNMGTSYVSGKQVSYILLDKLPATLTLGASTMAITLLVSLPIGILSAVKQNKSHDCIARFFCFLGNAAPNFLVAIALLYVFSIQLGWVPVIAPSGLSGMLLPSLTLAVPLTAQYIKQIRAAVLEEYSKDYVTAARARGIRERDILLRSVMKSTAPTLLTLLSMSIGTLLSGSVIVETIFMWDGIGKLAIDSITKRDYPVVQAYVLWMAVIYVLIHLVCDIATRFLLPRAHFAEKEGAFS